MQTLPDTKYCFALLNELCNRKILQSALSATITDVSTEQKCQKSGFSLFRASLWENNTGIPERPSRWKSPQVTTAPRGPGRSGDRGFTPALCPSRPREPPTCTRGPRGDTRSTLHSAGAFFLDSGALWDSGGQKQVSRRISLPPEAGLRQEGVATLWGDSGCVNDIICRPLP